MEKMKYIVIDASLSEAIYIFPDFVQHSDFARNVRFGDQEIVGAGFVTYGANGRLECYGDSFSLGVKSRGEEDTKLLDQMLRGFNPYEGN